MIPRVKSPLASYASNLGANVVAPVAAFVAAPILARALGVEDRGNVAAGVAPLLLIVSAVTLGLPEAAIYFASRRRGCLDARILWAVVAALLCVGTAATLGVWFAADALASGSGELAGLIQLSSYAIVPTLLLYLPRAIASARGQWRLVMLERVTASVVRLLALGWLFADGTLDMTTAVVVMAYSPLVGIVPYLGLRSSRANRPGREVAGEGGAKSTVVYSDFFGYGLRVWLGTLSGVLLARVDQLLIVPLSDATVLGVYVVAVSVAEVSLVVNTAIREVVFAKQSRDFSAERIVVMSRIATILTGVCVGASALCAPVLIPLLFGQEFAGAVVPALILLGGVLIGNPGSVAGAGLGACGRPGLRSTALAIAVVVNVVCLLALIRYGAVGAALATVAGSVVSANINILLFSRLNHSRIRDFYLVQRSDFEELRAAISPLRASTRRGSEMEP